MHRLEVEVMGVMHASRELVAPDLQVKGSIKGFILLFQNQMQGNTCI